MSHRDFILAYQKGDTGCSVSVWPMLSAAFCQKLPLAGVRRFLLGFCLIFSLALLASVWTFFMLPLLVAALLSGVCVFGFLAFFTIHTGELILQGSVADERLYRLALRRRVLLILPSMETEPQELPGAESHHKAVMNPKIRLFGIPR